MKTLKALLGLMISLAPFGLAGYLYVEKWEYWLWLAAGYGVMSLVAFAVYGIDKRKAVKGGWRIPEATLHLLELAGGWPGGLWGQMLLNHKSRKGSYQVVFWLIVFIHVGGWGWVISQGML